MYDEVTVYIYITPNTDTDGFNISKLLQSFDVQSPFISTI